MKVHDVMQRDSECVGPNDSLGAAAELMKRFHIRAVPVLDHAKPSGVVTEEALHTCKKELHRDPLLLRVHEVMVECTGFLLAEDELDDAVQTMKVSDAKQMAVFDQNYHLVGLLLADDLTGQP